MLCVRHHGYSLETTKKIKPHRRKAGSRNPLKNLARRDDIQTEYEEIRTDVADRELKRIKREQSRCTRALEYVLQRVWVERVCLLLDE